jgi:hypothetical protein
MADFMSRSAKKLFGQINIFCKNFATHATTTKECKEFIYESRDLRFKIVEDVEYVKKVFRDRIEV